MAAVSGIVSVLAAILVSEGIIQAIDYAAGNPEEDVSVALQNLAQQNRQRAITRLHLETAGAEEVERRFSQFNAIPQRALTEVAMMESGPPLVNTERHSELLEWVSGQIGVSPDMLVRASNPVKLGDFSQAHRRHGVPIPGSPTRSSGQVGGGGMMQQPQQPPAQGMGGPPQGASPPSQAPGTASQAALGGQQ